MITVVDGTVPPPAGDRNYDPHKLGGSSARGVKGLSISQIVMGSLCIIFEIAMVGLYYSGRGLDNTVNGDVAPGIWHGVLILIIGVVGVLTARRNTRGWIIAYMVINIIAAVEMPTFITMAGIATAQSQSCGDYLVFYIYGGPCETYAPLALNILNLIMAISQFIITIVAASLCCGPACCNSSARPMQTTMVIHSGQQQMSTNTVMGNQPGQQYSYNQPQQPYVQVVQTGAYPSQQLPAYPGQQQLPPNYNSYPQQQQQPLYYGNSQQQQMAPTQKY